MYRRRSWTPALKPPSTAKWLAETEGKIKKELTAKGMQITDPADGEKEWISKATTQVWPKFYESIGGKDKLDKILKSLGR